MVRGAAETCCSVIPRAAGAEKHPRYALESRRHFHGAQQDASDIVGASALLGVCDESIADLGQLLAGGRRLRDFIGVNVPCKPVGSQQNKIAGVQLRREEVRFHGVGHPTAPP